MVALDFCIVHMLVHCNSWKHESWIWPHSQVAWQQDVAQKWVCMVALSLQWWNGSVSVDGWCLNGPARAPLESLVQNFAVYRGHYCVSLGYGQHVVLTKYKAAERPFAFRWTNIRWSSVAQSSRTGMLCRILDQVITRESWAVYVVHVRCGSECKAYFMTFVLACFVSLPMTLLGHGAMCTQSQWRLAMVGMQPCWLDITLLQVGLATPPQSNLPIWLPEQHAAFMSNCLPPCTIFVDNMLLLGLHPYKVLAAWLHARIMHYYYQ